MITRRRFLTISAAAFALPATAQGASVTTWTGQALGARTMLRLAHPDAKAIAARALAEMARLERVFSLFQPDSALSQLNAAGRLANPPFELLECLSLAGAVHRASGGRFDPTVQPLWAAYAQAGDKPLGQAQRDCARRLTGWKGVTLAPEAITLRPGMALTLNGIAQGYIADRVATLLAAEGLTDILVDTGEFRALGGHPAGGAWPVRLASGGQVPLAQRALATSAPFGTCFDAGRRVGHILDPRTGQSAPSLWHSITVSAPSAALADALSTSACLAQTRAEFDTTLAQFPGAVLEAAIAAKG